MADVEIRRYANVGQYRAEAASMAAAGWRVAAQSERAVSSPGAGLAAAVLFAALGLFLWWFFIPALLCLVLAATSKRHELVVTYQPDATKPPSP